MTFDMSSITVNEVSDSYSKYLVYQLALESFFIFSFASVRLPSYPFTLIDDIKEECDCTSFTGNQLLYFYLISYNGDR